MWVAISQRNLKSDNESDRDINESDRNISDRDILENAYIKYFEDFGIKLIQIPNISQNSELYFEELPIKAIILSGGNDVNPELYNQKPVYAMELSVFRDNTEKKLLEIGIKKDLPVLGICRGMQFINVFFGGTMIQNIKEQSISEVEHVATRHTVKITDHNVSKLFGKTTIVVNSYHNQGICKEFLSPQLKAFALSEKDGIIEGIYHQNYPIAGIQWHPERPGSSIECDRMIIKAFIEKRLFWK